MNCIWFQSSTGRSNFFISFFYFGIISRFAILFHVLYMPRKIFELLVWKSQESSYFCGILFLLCMDLGKQVACTIEHYHHMLIVDDILDKRSRNFTRSGRPSRALCAGPWWKRTNWHSQKSTSNYEKMPTDPLPRSFAFVNNRFQKD